MAIDQAEINVEWDANRRVLVAPFKIIAGGNRITLLAHLEPPNGSVTDWRLGFSGGTIVLPGAEGEAPLIFNRIAIGVRFDTDNRRVTADPGQYQQWRDRRRRHRLHRLLRRAAADAGLCRHADVGVGAEADVADPDRAGSARMGDRADREGIDPEHRHRGQFAGQEPVAARSADPGRWVCSVNIVGTGATIHPVDEMPSVRDGD